MDFLKGDFKRLGKLDKVCIDNAVFRLHYKLTVAALVVSSILLTSKQFFGEPIQCNGDASKDFLPVVKSYCWMRGTYIIKDTASGDNQVDRMSGLGDDRLDSKEVVWQHYYQWVWLVLCAQALLFYVPRMVWKRCEGGRLRMMVSDLAKPLLPENAWTGAVKEQLLKYLTQDPQTHCEYAMRFIYCEVLNLVNVIVQIFLIDWFLGGRFSTYGISVLASTETNPMDKVFPKITKCTFYKFGASGSFEKRDVICVLPLNNLNEKIFLIMWFWFILLACVSGLALIYRAVIFQIPKVRVYLLMAPICMDPVTRKKQLSLIMEKMSYGEFFMLCHIGKNINTINPFIYSEIIEAIYEKLCSKQGEAGITDTSP